MNIPVRIAYVLLTILGLSTGLVKVLGMQQEMLIFRNAGFSDRTTLAFGAIQIVSTLLIWPTRTRKVGATALAATFIAATGVLFLNSYFVFGTVSISFIALAVIPVFRNFSTSPRQQPEGVNAKRA